MRNTISLFTRQLFETKWWEYLEILQELTYTPQFNLKLNGK